MLYPIELCFNQTLTPHKFRGVAATNYSTKQIIIPLIPRIIQLLSSPILISGIEYYSKEEIAGLVDTGYNSNDASINNDIPLYMLGTNYRTYLQQSLNNGDIFLAFNITTDGISIFDKPVTIQNRSSNPILIELLNYKRHRKIDTRKYYMYSCVQENRLDTCLDILVEELKLLHEGIIMDVSINGSIQKKRVVGLLINFFGDTTAITHVGKFLSPASTYPCRFCDMICDKYRNTFHHGMSCSFSQIEHNIINDSTSSCLYIPCSQTTLQWIHHDLLPIKNDRFVRYDYIPSKNQNNYKAFTNIRYSHYSKEIIEQIRAKYPDTKDEKGIKTTKSSLDKLQYFDQSSSFPLDVMHLFGNICNTLLSLLFGFLKDKENDSQSEVNQKATSNSNQINIPKYKQNIMKRNTQQVEDISIENEVINIVSYSKYKLSDDNLEILRTRLSAFNSIYGSCEYQFRYITEEIKFNKLSTHTKIFFISKVLPLILFDFSGEDSLIVPLIEIFASIIHDCSVYTAIDEKELEILKTKCYTFTFLCELLLTDSLITSQIHSVQHLTECIRKAGSLSISSTWKSEAYYSKIKHSSHSRNEFNISCCLTSIVKESILLSRQQTNDMINNIQKSNISNNSDVNLINKLFFDIYVPNTNLTGLSYTIQDNDTFIKMKHNFSTFKINFFEKIMMNNKFVFTTSLIDEGVMRIDNSYLLYFETNGTHNPHLIKALWYIQIEEFMLVRKYDYGIASTSSTGLFYNFKDDHAFLGFQMINSIVPSNIFVADIHVDQNIDNSIYREVYINHW
ncbi:hypothetical protein WA158_006965 [Blastocystis sp. Blastoise]